MTALHAQQASGSIDLPAGVRIVLQAEGDGVQIYMCTAGNDRPRWVLKAPDAKLMDAAGKIIGSHFAGPIWRLEDGSQVQGELIASQPALIKRVGRTYKHYLTDLGRRAVIGGLKVIQMALVPALATAPAFG